MLNKKFLIDITREVLNHTQNEYLRSDFTDWCEGASAIMYYILTNYTEEEDVHIANGTFNNFGHEWIVVNGEIIDATVDQFGDDYSIYSSSLYKNLYKEESEDYAPLVFDDWIEYIDNLFEDKERMNLTLEE